MDSICIYCGSADGISPEFVRLARSTGSTLARAGLVIIYGGGRTGLMGALADAALEAGGQVIGVITESMNTAALAHPALTRLEVTATIHQRKARMYELADGYIALPGGFGTLDELFETLTWGQIGEHAKPVGLLNVNGYYDPLLEMLDRAVAEKFLFPEHRRTLLCQVRPTAPVGGHAKPPAPARGSQALDAADKGMILLTTDLSDAALDLLEEGEARVDAFEVGPWFQPSQIEAYRRQLPDIPFHFHAADMLQEVGSISRGIAKISTYLSATRSPWVSIHLSMQARHSQPNQLRANKPLDTEQATRKFVHMVERLKRAVGVPVLLENDEPAAAEGDLFDIEPKNISEVLNITGCNLLLDSGHARISAERLHVDVHDYIQALPLKRVTQIHVSGPRIKNGCLFDAHEPLTEIDYDLFTFLLSRTHPKVVTLEYIREREALKEQLIRLRKLI